MADVTPEDDGPEVVVNDVTDEAPEVTVDEGDNVVIVNEADDGDDSPSEVVLEQVIDDAVTLAILSERVTALQVDVTALQLAVATLSAVDTVQEEEIETVAEDEEESEDETEDDAEEPEPNSAGPHPLFRPWGAYRKE